MDGRPSVLRRGEGVKQKQSTWIPGKPGRPPAWAADYVQKKNEKKAKKTQWQQPGDRGRPPLWAKDYDWY